MFRKKNSSQFLVNVEYLYMNENSYEQLSMTSILSYRVLNSLHSKHGYQKKPGKRTNMFASILLLAPFL